MAEEEQPTQKDLSTDSEAQSAADMWDLNRKLTYAGEHFDQRVENLNQKILADSQSQAMFWQAVLERQQATKLSSQELLERQQALKERQDQHALAIERGQQAIQHSATLNNVDYSQSRNVKVIEYRTIEPTREEVIQDATAGAINQAVDTVTRAMVDRTQTSAANVSELSSARQVADTNVLNTLSELAGIVNVMQTEAASTQAAYQALSNQVADLVAQSAALTAIVKAQAAE